MPEEDQTAVADEAQAAPDEEQVADAEPVHCRWCGQPNDAAPDGDWLCEHCGRYQDAMTCPTCGQLARVSALPDDMVPEAHAPARRRRARGE